MAQGKKVKPQYKEEFYKGYLIQELRWKEHFSAGICENSHAFFRQGFGQTPFVQSCEQAFADARAWIDRVVTIKGG